MRLADVRNLLTVTMILGVLAATHAAQAGETDLLAALRVPGHVLMLRHAYAPGVGDPARFALGDCRTQRNLDERGRAEARAIGRRLREAGIASASVLSSEWCRCLETARLLDVGEVQAAPALNSFFAHPEQGPSRLSATRALIAGAAQGQLPVIMVTHDVTIAGLTGRRLASGEGVVLRTRGSELETVGTLSLAAGR